MKFDFTPDPKVLIALTHTPMQPLDALCELIDNSIDSFYTAKIQGVNIEEPIIVVQLPEPRQISLGEGILRVQDNGPGMSPENAEKALKAGYSGNNPYDTLGLFGMGFNIATGKLGNITTFMTSRKDMDFYVKTEINLEKINESRDYSLEVEEISKNDFDEYFKPGSHGTFIEVRDWWPEGNANYGFIQKLVKYGTRKIAEELGRRYASILRENKIRIYVNNKQCKAYEHCVWDDSRYVVRKNGNVPAVMRFNQIVASSKRCGECRTILSSTDTKCPACGSTKIRTTDECVSGWIGIQRYDHTTDFGIDLIRNGRAIRIGEKSAFFEYVDDLKHVTKDYPIDSQYGRIVGEIHLDFVPVDFLKQDFQRNSAEWQRAISFIRGDSSLQPNQPGASENSSPLYKLYQAYRKVRIFGRHDMYMGYWDAEKRSAQRISRDIEKEYLEKFKQRLPGYLDDSEWWKLVETADQPPVEELPECPNCGAQNLKDADECVVCGEILKPKICVNEQCGKTIPFSAAQCPYCGASQVPTVIKPWLCRVCGNKNQASNKVCGSCGSPRGANHPLSKEELLSCSQKIDSLSNPNLKVELGPGNISNPQQIEVYAAQKPMKAPGSEETWPLIIDKEIGKLQIFLDLSHPFFTNCNLSKEQLIASEIAMYLYDENPTLQNKHEFNLSNLTWKILRTNWLDTIEISKEKIIKDARELMNTLRIQIMEVLGEEGSKYFDDLSNEEKKDLTSALLDKGIDISLIGFLKDSGEYIQYAPYSFLITLYRENPDFFFNQKVWNKSLVQGGEDLLGLENVNQVREKIITQYDNYLQDIVLFLKNQYSNPLDLRRIQLTIEILHKEMSE